MAPGYLSALCQPVSGVPGRRHLRSAGRGELGFPRVNLSTYGGRALLVLIANRKSYMSFRLVPKSVTLKGEIALILRDVT